MEAWPHPSDTERSDADPRLIAALAAGIAIFLIASPLVLRVAYPLAPEAAAIDRDLPRPPPPVLEVNPKQTSQAQRARDAELLGSYGWVDPARKTARIPIERAMQLLAERGLAGWPSGVQSSR
jgi:hypothetical protein